MAASTSQRPIRAAVIGFGLAGRVFHSPFISAVRGLELATIVQRHGNEASAAYPAAKIARSVEEALQDRTIDLLVVATPNETHYDLAKAALAAGKHCVVDKPFAATSDQASELVALSEKHGKLVIPFHNRRFDGDFQTVRKILFDEKIGRLVEVSSRFDRFRPKVRENSWKEASNSMSGIFFDLGAHLLDQALALFGKPDSVDARIYRDRDGTGIDDAFELTLDYKAGGLRYRCGSTLLAAEPEPRFRLNGTKGSYLKFGVDPQEAAVGGGKLPPNSDSSEPWLPEPREAWGTLTLAEGDSQPPCLKPETCPTLTGDYRKFYENVRDAINGEADLLIQPEDGYRCIRLLELAQESNAKRRSIDVSF